MKVLLIEPPISAFDVPTGIFALPPPHHLEILGGALIGEHDVRILDMRIDGGIDHELSDFKPDVVGCSCVAANSYLAKGVLKKAKSANPEVFTVIGGHHPSLKPEDCNEPYIDATVIGEGEVTCKELLRKLESGRTWLDTHGIAFRSLDEDFRINPRRELMDLKELPPTARRLTQRYRGTQSYFRGNWRPVDCIISSRGCPYRCTFCGLWKINHGKYRVRDPELVAEELEMIKAPFVAFIDDNTLDHVDKAWKLAEIIEQKGIKKTYELYGCVDTIVRHPEIVEKWRKIGMELLLLGLESCDDQRLAEVKKKTTVEMNRQAIEICHANEIEIVAYFIVDPQFDREDFHRLSDFVAQNHLTHPVFTILSPFPGTDLYNEVKDSLITDSFEILDFFHTVLPTKLSLDDFYEEFLGLYRRAYPFKNFVKSVFQRKAVLSPRMLAMHYKVRKRMNQLRHHHDLVGKRSGCNRDSRP